MSFNQQQASLFTVSVTNRTVTPSGIVKINDERPRTPTGALVLTGTTYGAVFDVYAQAVGNTQYALIALATGTDITGRTDIVLVGHVIDYGAIANVCQWLPLPGGSIDAILYTDANGVHFRPFGSLDTAYVILENVIDSAHNLVLRAGSNAGVSSAHGMSITSTGQILFETTDGVNGMRWDLGVGFGAPRPSLGLTLDGLLLTNGHLRSNGNAPTIAYGAGAGTGASGQVSGTDTWGALKITTGTTPAAGNAILCTVTFAAAYPSAPVGVPITISSPSARDLARNQDVAATTITTTNFIVTCGAAALAASTTYIWNYVVLGG